MAERITDSARLERELNELQGEIQASLRTVGQLREVQRHFEGLLATYNSIKAYQKRAETELYTFRGETERLLGELAERDETFSTRFMGLTNANDELWKTYRHKFLELHNQLGATQKNFRLDMATQQREFEGGVEERLAAYTTRLENELSASEAKIEAVSEGIRSELQELNGQVRGQGNYAEQLGREQRGLASDASEMRQRIGGRASGALSLGVINLILILALGAAVFYVLFFGGEPRVRALFGL